MRKDVVVHERQLRIQELLDRLSTGGKPTLILPRPVVSNAENIGLWKVPVRRPCAWRQSREITTSHPSTPSFFQGTGFGC